MPVTLASKCNGIDAIMRKRFLALNEGRQRPLFSYAENMSDKSVSPSTNFTRLKQGETVTLFSVEMGEGKYRQME